MNINKIFFHLRLLKHFTEKYFLLITICSRMLLADEIHKYLIDKYYMFFAMYFVKKKIFSKFLFFHANVGMNI